MFHQPKNKLRIYWRYLLQYSIFIMVIVAVLFPFYLTSLNLIRTSLKEKTEISLMQGANDLDNELKDFLEISHKLSEDPDIIACFTLTDSIEPSEYLLLNQAATKLQELTSSLSLSENIYIYLKNSSHVISSGKIYPKILSNTYPYDDFDTQNYQNIHTSLFSTNRNHYKGVIDLDPNNNIITYTTYLSNYSTQISSAAFQIQIPFAEFVDSFIWGEIRDFAIVQIQDQNENLIEYNIANIFNTKQFEQFSIKSSYSNLNIKILIDQAYFDQQMHPVKVMIFLYTSIALIIFIIIALFFSRYNSRPFTRILQYLAYFPINQPSAAVYSNELQYIDYALSSIRDSTQAMQEHSKILESTVKQKLLESMLQYTDENDLILFERYYPNFPKCFRLILLSANEKAALPKSTQLSEIFKNCICFDIENTYQICIIENIDLALLKSQLEQITNKQTRIAVSLPFESPRFLSYANTQTEYILQFLEISGCLIADEMSFKQFVYDKNVEQKIIENLLTGNAKRSTELLMTQWYELSLLPFPDNRIEQLFYWQSSLFQQAIQHLQYDIKIPQYHEKLSIVELAMELCSIAEKICEYALFRRNLKESETADMIVQYVDQNAYNESFSLAVLEEAFHLSSKTLNKIFKEQTGFSISDYILEKKLERSQDLLKQENININEITEACGFSSQNTFYKAFRRKFGISPSSYRENHQNP